MWPTVFPQYVRDERKVHELRIEDIVPSRMEDILTWLQVIRINGGADHFRQYTVVHAQAQSNNLVEITIRVQGFFKNGNLSVFGNWNRQALILVYP